MSVRMYLVIMSITTIVAWLGWGAVVTSIDPETAGLTGFIFFYVSLFLSLLGTFSVLGFALRFLFQRQKRGTVYKVSTAFRQAFLWSLAINMALGLQSQRLLVWWMLILLVVAFALVEFTFISIQRQKQENG